MCSRVADELKERGHEIRVLTSQLPDGSRADPADGVARELEVVYPDWQRHWTPGSLAKRYRVQRCNYEAARKAVSEFGPDLVYAWGMGNITLAPALAAQDAGLKVVFDNGDPALLRQWPSTFARRAALSLMRVLPRRRMGLDELDLDYGTFVSESLKAEFLDAGLPVAGWPVFYRGIRAGSVRRRNVEAAPHTRRVLYAGRLHPEKGVEFALAAMGKLIRQKGAACAHLTIAGGGAGDYVSKLEEQVAELKLKESVEFVGKVAPDDMQALYDKMEIMIFPSVWAEPLSIGRLEAMARGLVLVSTDTGGGAEVVRDGENALVVGPQNADAIADALARLLDSPPLMQNLSDGAVQTISSRFLFEDIIPKIDHYLQEAAKRAAGSPRPTPTF
jgi:glycosyltransferase involved in cell wall biosynthesis